MAARILPGLTREGAAGARTSSPEEHLRRRSASGRLLAVPRRVGLALQDLHAWDALARPRRIVQIEEPDADYHYDADAFN